MGRSARAEGAQIQRPARRPGSADIKPLKDKVKSPPKGLGAVRPELLQWVQPLESQSDQLDQVGLLNTSGLVPGHSHPRLRLLDPGQNVSL